MLCFRCGSHNPDGSEFCQHCGQNLLSLEKLVASEKVGGKISLPSSKSGGGEFKQGQFLVERYQLKMHLGSGPSGEVWRAHDIEIEVDVAVKIIRSNLLQTREERNHFQSVIRGVRAIQHQNLVRIYGEEQENDRCIVVMQLLEGLSLRKIINLRLDKKQVFQPSEIEPIFAHLCQALEKIHETSLHGDLKPENIIVLPDILKVTDLGLFEGLPREPFLAAQKSMGKAGFYLAPELYRGGKIGTAADIYSLGVILCEMLTGKLYEGPASSLPDLTGEASRFRNLLVRALNENPERRYSTVQELFNDLCDATGSSESVARVSTSPSRGVEKGKASEAKTSKASLRAPETEYPPTVIDTRLAVGGGAAKGEAESPIPVSEEQIVEDIAERVTEEQPEQMVTDEQILQETEEAKQLLASEEGESEEDLADGETVTQPGPPPALFKNMEARVARPISPPSNIPAEEAKAGKPIGAPGPSQTAVKGQVVQQSPTSGPTISYGPFSQPPFPPSFVTQPPVPKPIGLPVYIFLTGVLIIVAIGVYFLIDYLRAQAELARAQAQAALLQRQAAPLPSVPAAAEPKAEEKQPTKPPEAPTASIAAQPAPATSQPTSSEPPVSSGKPESAKVSIDSASIGEPAQKATAELPATMAAVVAATEKEESKIVEHRRDSKKHARPVPLAATKKEDKPPAAEPEAKKTTAPAGLPPVEEPPEATVQAEKSQPASSALPAPATPAPPAPMQPAAAQPVTSTPISTSEPTSPAPKEEKNETQVAAASPKCPAGMVFIPAGKASIGSSPDDPMRGFGELNLHTVEVNAFCIDLYEYPNVKGKKPTGGVSFNEAKNLCKKRGKRLCTEVEWEYACKGSGNRSYPYGNQYSAESCNTKDAQGNDRPLAESGSFSACRSPFGVWDMSGNLSEWTDTPFGPGLPAMTYKGGSHLRPDWATRCAARSSAQPGIRKEDLGFRCCADPK